MDLVVTSLPGFPREAELAERYARASGRDASDFAFFEVLAMYKVLVITEDVRARFLAGDNIGEGGELMGRSVPDIAEALLETARASSVPGLGG
jgi:aminoglycoside phosphotransferase (APT) family kinase protein